MPMPISSATSRTVKRRFPRITARTLSTWSSFVDVEGRPGLRSSPIDLLPSLKCLNHSWYYVWLIQSSPYAWLSSWNVFVKFLPSLQQNFTHTHTRCSSSSFIVTLSLIRRTACARAQFSGCSSTTNAHTETGQMAVCCQNLTLGALNSRSALSVLVGALFKKFGLVLKTPRACVCVCVCLCYIYIYIYIIHAIFKYWTISLIWPSSPSISPFVRGSRVCVMLCNTFGLIVLCIKNKLLGNSFY